MIAFRYYICYYRVPPFSLNYSLFQYFFISRPLPSSYEICRSRALSLSSLRHVLSIGLIPLRHQRLPPIQLPPVRNSLALVPFVSLRRARHPIDSSASAEFSRFFLRPPSLRLALLFAAPLSPRCSLQPTFSGLSSSLPPLRYFFF